MTAKIFLHGLEGSTQGTKAVYFREKYPDMILEDFMGDLDQRMKKLENVLSDRQDICIVGSSFGGLMATLYALEHASRVAKMILLAPAINVLDRTSYEGRHISVPVWIYHGRSDEVIPLDEVASRARELFTHLSFHTVDDDHFLHKTFKGMDWDTLLS